MKRKIIQSLMATKKYLWLEYLPRRVSGFMDIVGVSISGPVAISVNKTSRIPDPSKNLDLHKWISRGGIYEAAHLRKKNGEWKIIDEIHRRSQP